MPQMAPLMWVMLFFCPLSLLIMIIIFLNFYKKFINKSEKIIKNPQKHFNWMW